MVQVAGLLLVLLGAGHLVGATLGSGAQWRSIFRASPWNSVPPPWTDDDLARQKAFWTSAGSFAGPCIVLGGLLVWLGDQPVAIPGWIGWALGGWALLGCVLAPRGGFWLALVPSALLILA